MLFNSQEFLIFLPIVIVVYYALPKAVRYLWLLAASYYFYMCWDPVYIVLILFTTLVTYICGLIIELLGQNRAPGQKQTGGQKLTLFICIVLNLAVLIFFKYFNFFNEVTAEVLAYFHVIYVPQKFNILLPVGISFYTFQAMGYAIDVYRGTTYAEKNPFRYALFVAFFPQLVAGPIERSKNLLKQLAKPMKGSFDDMREGFLLMLWGFFLKIVIADRAAIYVDTVFSNHTRYRGVFMILGIFLFAIQIYCDFNGYSTIAMGAALMLGVRLTDNFFAPYLSASPSEFWRRWHISLSGWFRDYVYIPLGGSHCGFLRRYLNILVTMFVSGLWHGANYTYVVWGLLHGAFQILADIPKSILRSIRKERDRKMGVRFDRPDRNGRMHHSAYYAKKKKRGFFYGVWHIIATVITFCMVDFAWIFFRAESMEQAVDIIKNLFTRTNLAVFLNGGMYKCGLDVMNFNLLMLCILFLFFADLAAYNGLRLRDTVIHRNGIIQSVAIAGMICFILLMGMWGPLYDSQSFIYFQF